MNLDQIIEYMNESQNLDEKLMDLLDSKNYNYMSSSLIQDINSFFQTNIDIRKDARIKLENYSQKNQDSNNYQEIQNVILKDKDIENHIKEHSDTLFENTNFQQKLISIGRKNRYSMLYYSSYNKILEKIVIYLLIMILISLIQNYLTIIPNFIYNIIQIIVSVVMLTYIILQYNDHLFRNNIDYDKYDFPNTNIDYSGAINNDNILDETEYPIEEEEVEKELCINNECCPDSMYYNSLKNKCDFKN